MKTTKFNCIQGNLNELPTPVVHRKKGYRIIPLILLILSLGLQSRAQNGPNPNFFTNITGGTGLANNAINSVSVSGTKIYAACSNGLSISADSGVS